MKNKILHLKDKFIEETIKASFMVLLYLFYNKNLYTQKDFFTKLRDSSAIIIPYLFYMLVISISSFISQPLVLNIKLKNFSIPEKEETILYHYKNFREDASKITLILEVKESHSIRGSLAKWIFKNRKFTIKIAIQPLMDEFLCEPCIYSDELNFQGSFFTINISDIILNNLENNIPSSMEYPFIIKENQDKPPFRNCDCAIKPILLIDGQKLGFFNKLFIKYILDLKDGYYSIKFIK